MNKKAYPLNLSINGNDLNKTGERQNFLYLCHPQNIPGDVRVKELITLAAGLMNVSAEKKKEILGQHQLNAIRHRQFKKLDLDELGRVCLAILDMKIFDIYLVNDITREMTMDFALQLKDRLKALSQQNALVLLLHTDSIPMVKNMNYLFLGTGDMFVKPGQRMLHKEFNFDREVETIDTLVWLMENSPFFKNTMLSLASKTILENEPLIRRSLQKNLPAKEEKKE